MCKWDFFVLARTVSWFIIIMLVFIIPLKHARSGEGLDWLVTVKLIFPPLSPYKFLFFFIIKINMDFVTKESIPLCELYICIFWMSCLYFYSGLTEANRFKWADTSLGGGLSSSGHHHMWLLITVYSLCFTVIKPHLRFHLNAWHFRFCIITDYFESKTIGTLSSISPLRRKVLIRVSWMHHLSDPPASLLWSRH